MAGAVGGLVGGALFGNAIVRSDPMPGRQIISLVGIIATGLVVAGVTAIVSGLHLKQQARR